MVWADEARLNAAAAFTISSETYLREAKTMYAVIVTGGKQYRVQKDDVLSVELLDNVEAGQMIELGRVLALNDGSGLKIGSPVLADVKVTAEVGSLDTVKHMVAQGFGFAIASRAAILGEIRAGTLVGVPLDPPLYTPLEVIILKDKFRSRLVNTFADFVIEEIARLSADRNP